MTHIVVLGAGTGGLPAAYELRALLGSDHRITVVNASDTFQFVPSNPWVALGWRHRKEVTFPLRPYLARKDIGLVAQRALNIEPEHNRLVLLDGSLLDYDYLVISTGPRLAFELVPGSGPDTGHTHSVCTLDHAEHLHQDYKRFLENPGHVVVGAFQGASCYGPAYEYVLALETDLRKRRLRHKVPITFVTSEPYIGHMGLGGVGDSKGMLESEFRQRHIKWITNARTTRVEAGRMRVEEVDAQGEKLRDHELEFGLSMMLPPFRGVEALARVPGLTNEAGFVLIDEHQRNPTWHNIYAAGVAVAIPPVEATPVPVGTPKTGYMIESMVSALVHNIQAQMAGQAPSHTATLSTICLADMGDTGAAFVAIPQIPPRNVTWSRKGRWVHYAKVAFEKYFMRKMKSGDSEPIYEKFVLKAIGVSRLNPLKRGGRAGA